ncbi:hypothetical protein [Nostoc parmelioides]|uniref:hypothetical protein n=1 Tax=Nostoc parmelioides TaxID=1521621 RepID=UPI0018EF913E|nr:hypothetical protein [Nostoc parmelioides]
MSFYYNRFPVSWFCFECGIIGGFVSIQQRLKKVEDEELEYLSQSWIAILVNPIFGGLFALVLYVLFLSGIIESALFPKFAIPEFKGQPFPTTDDLRYFFTTTYPASGSDFAKLAFWSFVAGFSERLVPQMIQRVAKNDDKNGE